MYTLRSPLFTYEVGHAADLRRPRTTLDRVELPRVLDLARTLCRDEANARTITALVHDATGRAASGPVLHERFAELVACGRLVLRELTAPDAYPLPDPYAESPADLVELLSDDPTDEEPPRSWISLELVHAAGLSSERVELELTTASGRELHGRLDADGGWRCDDVDGGTCTIRLLDHPVLRRQRRARARHVPPQRGDVLWRVGSDPRLDLRSAQHHRIVIVQAPEPYCPSA